MSDEKLFSKRKFLKFLLLCIILAFVNIVAFSKAFFGISVHSGNIFEMTISIFLPIISVIIFCAEGYSILSQKDIQKLSIDFSELKEDSEVYKKNLKKIAKELPFLAKELNELKNQIKRMDKKQEALLEYFKQNNIERKCLEDEATNARKFLLNNVKNVLSKCIIIGALDQDATVADSRNVYQEQIQDFKNIIKFNEKNLDEFDCFLGEVLKSGEAPVEENMSLQATIEVLRQIRQMNNKE